MLVRFTKGPPGTNADLLTCIREDGTRTSVPLGRQGVLPREAIQFVVEATLGWPDGWFGAIAQGLAADAAAAGRIRGRAGGRSHGDPETPEAEVRPQAEIIAGCLQAEQWGGATDRAAFQKKVADACRRRRVAPPLVTAAMLDRLRAAVREFGAAWRPLPPGRSLDRRF